MAKYLTFTYRGRMPNTVFPKRGQLATLRRLTAANPNLSIMLVDRDGDWITASSLLNAGAESKLTITSCGPVLSLTCQSDAALRVIVENGRLKKVHPTYFDC